jgi:hypothetical protein
LLSIGIQSVWHKTTIPNQRGRRDLFLISFAPLQSKSSRLLLSLSIKTA